MNLIPRRKKLFTPPARRRQRFANVGILLVFVASAVYVGG